MKRGGDVPIVFRGGEKKKPPTLRTRAARRDFGPRKTSEGETNYGLAPGGKKRQPDVGWLTRKSFWKKRQRGGKLLTGSKKGRGGHVGTDSSIMRPTWKKGRAIRVRRGNPAGRGDPSRL